jgi:hypothetical protein
MAFHCLFKLASYFVVTEAAHFEKPNFIMAITQNDEDPIKYNSLIF